MSDMDPASRDGTSPPLRGPVERRKRSGPTMRSRAGASGRNPAALRPAGSFDNRQARQAWRQFARARGVASRDAESGKSWRWGPWLFLALGVVAAGTIYESRSRKLGRAAAVAQAEAVADAGEGDDAAAGAATTPKLVPPSWLALPSASDPLSRSQPRARVDNAVEADSPFLPKLRDPPKGTPRKLAKALQSVPKSPSDRAPIGGVGVYGVHVDRIVVGPRREDRSCNVARRTLSQSGDGAVQVCFRVVHQRRAQRLLVHWLRDGELVRRTFLSVPAERAYRTRAWMPLARPDLHGAWTAIVKTEDGVELARIGFDVAP